MSTGGQLFELVQYVNCTAKSVQLKEECWTWEESHSVIRYGCLAQADRVLVKSAHQPVLPAS